MPTKMKTPKKRPPGIDALIKALPTIHEDATSVAKLFASLKDDMEISDKAMSQIDNWLRDAKCDQSRKIARCCVKCIYGNWLECCDS